MTRLLSGLLVLILLLVAGSAWASDYYADDIIDPDDAPDARDEDGDRAVVADGGLEPGAAQLGMYFGAGDEFLSGGFSATSEGYPAGGYASGHLNSEFSSHDEQIYYPDYDRYEYGYSQDNVYGPMWGVDPNTQGLEGYDPNYYYLMSGGDPNQLPADRRPRDTDESGQPVDTEEGIKITSNDIYW